MSQYVQDSYEDPHKKVGDGSNKVCCRREEHKEDSCIERKTGKREREICVEKKIEKKEQSVTVFEKNS